MSVLLLWISSRSEPAANAWVLRRRRCLGRRRLVTRRLPHTLQSSGTRSRQPMPRGDDRLQSDWVATDVLSAERPIHRQQPRTRPRSPPIKDHVEAGQRDGNGRTSCGDEHPPVSNPYGNRGQTQSTEHRQDVDCQRIVTAFLGHRRRVSHAINRTATDLHERRAFRAATAAAAVPLLQLSQVRDRSLPLVARVRHYGGPAGWRSKVVGTPAQRG